MARRNELLIIRICEIKFTDFLVEFGNTCYTISTLKPIFPEFMEING